MKKWGWIAGTPALGRSGMGIPIPIEIGEAYRNKKKITPNTEHDQQEEKSRNK